MYLSESKSLRMTTLCGLYVAQGIPWGFVTVTFAAWLAKPEHGITAEQLGPILAVATLPWSFKFLWGPLMDRYTIRSCGRRRPWIIFAQTMAILVLGSMMFFDDLPGMVWTSTPDAGAWMRTVYGLVPGPLAAMILLANVFVSMQDVAVDALAVDLLEEHERGVANGLMYGSSYVGTAMGGAGLGYVVANHGIQAGLCGQALLLFLIMLLPVFFRERRPPNGKKASDSTGDENHHADQRAGTVDLGESPFFPTEAAIEAGEHDSGAPSATGQSNTAGPSIFGDLLRAFRLRATLLGALVAVGVKIGIGVLTAVLVDYLMKDGGWSQQDYSEISGGWALLLGLSGSAAGGLVADRVGPKPVILTTSVLLGLLWISFGVIPNALASKSLAISLLLSQELLLATLTVGLFSLFMSISWPRVAATQFTAYMALMNLSTTIGSYLAGRLSTSFSIPQILIIAGLLQMVLVIPVLFIDPRQTRRVLGEAP